MRKFSIYMIIIFTVVYGSVARGADKLELDTKTTLSIINTVMDFYYARHHGDMEKLQTLFLKKMSTNKVKNYIGWTSIYDREKDEFRKIKVFDEEKMEFKELNISPENPDIAGVVVRVWYKKGISIPPYEDALIILKKIGDKWKILEITEPGLP